MMHKIVVYSPTFYPVIDGTSIQAKRLHDLLSQNNEVTGIGFSVDRDMNKIEVLESDNIIRLLPEYKSKEKFPVLSGKPITEAIKNIDPEILHLRGWYQFEVINELINNFHDRKIFMYSDGLHECNEYFSGQTTYFNYIKNAISKKINFIANSNEDIEILTSLGISSKKIFLMPPIINSSTKTNESWETPKFLSMGRFFSYKKHNLVFKSFNEADINGELILAGAADSYESLIESEKLERAGANVVKNPNDEEKSKLYDWATHHVLASNKESLGITTLEAICSNCLPIARKIGGISSYIGDEFLFSNDSELKNKIKMMSNKKIYEELMDKLSTTKLYLMHDSIMKKYEELQGVV